jgi:tRNA dimethylallyltransferase
MKQIAILGPTASGKTALSIELAQKIDANILSLDSLSIYKEVDIVSAKPTLDERDSIKHFGIDELFMSEYFSAATFFDIYKKAKESSLKDGKNLVIVGGTSFYLKSMIDGLSQKITLSDQNINRLEEILLDLATAFKTIKELDSNYASKISANDTFRIEKWYEIYLETNITATNYFKQNRQTPIIKNIPIFDIQVDREALRARIKDRTIKMVNNGLIDEIFNLEKKYTRKPKPMGAIGIKETLSFLDGEINKNELIELITIHTAQLAKRQETFNKSKFPDKINILNNNLEKILLLNF